MTQNTRIAIAAGAPETAAAGARVAEEGGNVVDVAVASALAATVSEVLLASLGGSCFIMLRLGGQAPVLIDGADAVPTLPGSIDKSNIDCREVVVPYGDGIKVQAGNASIAVPGAPAALHHAWSRFGKLPWKQVVAPALDLSRQALPVGKTLAEWLAMAGNVLFAQQAASRQCFVPDGQNPLAEGQTYRLPDLDTTLEIISREGVDAFYRGDLAKRISHEILSQGGFVTRDNLATYQAIERTPLSIESAGYQVALNPPPAVGGVALGSLIRCVEKSWNATMSMAQRAELLAHAQLLLIKLRSSEFVAKNFSHDRAREVLQPEFLARSARGLESPNTTHLSVAGADGSLVSITMSMGYGAGITIPRTGISMNDSLGEPELNPHGFFAAPSGSRLISNMAPTIAWNSPFSGFALGSPGASRITTALAQLWIRFAFEKQELESAISAPRLHVEQQTDRIRVLCEPGIDTSELENRYSVRRYDRPNMFFGAPKVAGCLVNQELVAVADPRRYGGVQYA